jgi:polyhydroxybutyrate depolymerase
MYRMRSRLLPLLVVAAVGLAVVPSVAAGAGTTRARGCGKSAAPGLTTQHLAVDGTDREYLLSIPPSYNASKRAPLLFNFHGLGSDMQQQALYSGLNQKAGAEGYVVITPNGSGNALRRWSFPPLPGSAADVNFVKTMLATTQRTLCIDPKRIFSTGISNGAIFSTVLACALPGRLAAIAPVAGVNATDVCGTGTPPTAVLAFHGTADPIVPYNGGAYFSGVNARRTAGIQAQPVDDAVANWARFDGCGTPATTTAVAGDVEHITYPDCPPSGTVELYRVVGGGHTWPGSIPIARLGPTTSSIDASALMLAFFDAHPRTG